MTRMRLGHIALAALALLVPTVVAAFTGYWFPTALPAGVLLGFFLAKGDLCGASAFGEIVLMRDGRKLYGLFVAGVTAMAAFAVADAVGVVTLAPRPLTWASYLVGGAVFGVGMVLAGGCVSGSLYKAGIGHANSMVALVFVGVGMHAVDFGPLQGVHATLLEQVIEGPGGGPVTLPSLTGLPFAVLAAGFAGLAVAIGVRSSHRRSPPPGALRRAPRDSLLRRALIRPWRPWSAGIAVGLLAVPAWLSSMAAGRDFPLCVSYGVEELPLPLLASDIDYIWRAGAVTPVPGGTNLKVYVWLVIFVLAVVIGSHLAASLAGRARFYPRPRGEIAGAAIGGLLVGVGAALARGCILGNGVTGLALMSVGMILFTVVAMLANWATTRIYVMGR